MNTTVFSELCMVSVEKYKQKTRFDPNFDSKFDNVFFSLNSWLSWGNVGRVSRDLATVIPPLLHSSAQYQPLINTVQCTRCFLLISCWKKEKCRSIRPSLFSSSYYVYSTSKPTLIWVISFRQSLLLYSTSSTITLHQLHVALLQLLHIYIF